MHCWAFGYVFFLLFSQNKNVQIVFKDRESSVGLVAIWQEWQWINGCTVQFCIHTCLNASLHTYTPLKSSAHRYANRIIVKRKKKHVPFWQQQLTFKKQTIKYETNTCRKHFHRMIQPLAKFSLSKWLQIMGKRCKTTLRGINSWLTTNDRVH